MASRNNSVDKKIRINVSLPVTLNEQIAALATIDQISVSYLISKVLSEYCETRNAELQQYLKALEAIRISKSN